jgi:hypothetical protein
MKVVADRWLGRCMDGWIGGRAWSEPRQNGTQVSCCCTDNAYVRAWTGDLRIKERQGGGGRGAGRETQSDARRLRQPADWRAWRSACHQLWFRFGDAGAHLADRWALRCTDVHACAAPAHFHSVRRRRTVYFAGTPAVWAPALRARCALGGSEGGQGHEGEARSRCILEGCIVSTICCFEVEQPP